MTTHAPPFTDPARLVDAMRTQGYALVAPQDLARLTGCSLAELDALVPSWNRLAPDNYLKDGGVTGAIRASCSGACS
ncbi:MAG: hypothetical protein ACLGI6_06465 [Gammaproteobacteria bacterium]